MRYKDVVDEAMASARMLGCVLDFLIIIALLVGLYFLVTRLIL